MSPVRFWPRDMKSHTLPIFYFHPKGDVAGSTLALGMPVRLDSYPLRASALRAVITARCAWWQKPMEVSMTGGRRRSCEDAAGLRGQELDPGPFDNPGSSESLETSVNVRI